jgi:hypothetical protein
MKEPQAMDVVIAFFAGLAIIGATARLIGPVRKERWFKKRRQDTFFNRRGMLGEMWNFGHPRTWQGVVVVLAMFGVIFLLGYIIVFRLV